MRTLSALIMIIVFGFLAGMYLPWQCMAFVPFVMGFSINRTWWSAALSGFAGMLLLWLAMLLYQNFGNEGALANRMAEVFGLNGGYLLWIITLSVGALLGLLSSLTGYFLRHSSKQKRKSKYHV